MLPSSILKIVLIGYKKDKWFSNLIMYAWKILHYYPYELVTTFLHDQKFKKKKVGLLLLSIFSTFYLFFLFALDYFC